MSDALATLREAVEHALADDGGRPLADVLYAGWYACCTHGPGGSDGAFTVEALRAAHADSLAFDGGWIAEDVQSSGRVFARRGDTARALDPLDYVADDRPGLPPRLGGTLRATRRRDSVSALPSYWATWGGRWGHPGHDPGVVVRAYWNLGSAGAPALVAALTGELTARSLDYSLKVPRFRAGFDRRDAVVLYLDRDDFAVAGPALRCAHAATASYLQAATPALTRTVAPGLGLAEEPPGRESFGGHRCRLIADALTARLASGDRDPVSLLHAVADRLTGAGISLDRTHLNPGQDDLPW